MARQTLSLLLFATATVAVGCYLIPDNEICQIETPEVFERLKSGQLPHECTLYIIIDTAHHNLLAEVPEIARLNPVPRGSDLQFEDSVGNHISIDPAKRSAFGSFRLGAGKNRMSFLPSDYDWYDIITDTTTAEDLDIIEQWPMTASIYITSERSPSEEVMQRFEVLRQSRNFDSFVYSH